MAPRSPRSSSARRGAKARPSFPSSPLGRLSVAGWARLVALGAVAFFGLSAAAFSYAPAALLRPVYPLDYVDCIKDASKRYSVDATLVAAIIQAESQWDPSSQSVPGAVGLMQLMPETAEDMAQLGYVDADEYDPGDLTDPATNIEYGCAYLSYLLDYFNGSTERAIAAYNAGLAHVEDWVQDDTVLHNAITFPETQAYLIKVENAWSRYRVLYGAELG